MALPTGVAVTQATDDEPVMDAVEQASAESFPCSDPPGWTPICGVKAAPDAIAAAASRLMLENLRTKLSDLNRRLAQAHAEHEEAARQAERDLDRANRFAASGLIRDLLETADNLRRAIDSMDETHTADGLAAGLAATEFKLMQTFARHGIVKIEPAPGSIFDPDSQEAVLAIDQPEQESGTIARVLQPGYAYHERLLRPALVIVAR